jgi:hypothetical protein
MVNSFNGPAVRDYILKYSYKTTKAADYGWGNSIKGIAETGKAVLKAASRQWIGTSRL